MEEHDSNGGTHALIPKRFIFALLLCLSITSVNSQYSGLLGLLGGSNAQQQPVGLFSGLVPDLETSRTNIVNTIYGFPPDDPYAHNQQVYGSQGYNYAPPIPQVPVAPNVSPISTREVNLLQQIIRDHESLRQNRHMTNNIQNHHQYRLLHKNLQRQQHTDRIVRFLLFKLILNQQQKAQGQPQDDTAERLQQLLQQQVQLLNHLQQQQKQQQVRTQQSQQGQQQQTEELLSQILTRINLQEQLQREQQQQKQQQRTKRLMEQLMQQELQLQQQEQKLQQTNSNQQLQRRSSRF